MSVLVGIPVVTNGNMVRQCLESLPKDDVLVVDNGSRHDVKEVIKPYKKIVNEKNLYVNPAWNQILEHFLESNYDKLIILNSDTVCHPDMTKHVDNFDFEVIDSKIMPYVDVVKDWSDYDTFPVIKIITGGNPGISMCLDKKMAEIVYPIPEQIKIWFGDTWIRFKLEKEGYTRAILKNAQLKHKWSQTIKEIPEAPEVIKQDKENWKEVQKWI